MPPNVKITKEDIIASAVEIVREKGASALNARDISKKLGCSTQPIFSNFTCMKELEKAVIIEAEKIFDIFLEREIRSGEFPAYKASGMAYIRFADEECELFKLLYMRDRSNEEIPESTVLYDSMTNKVSENTGLENGQAELFHLEMWGYVHGIATMTATGYLKLERNLISRSLTDVYEGLKHRFKEGEK